MKISAISKSYLFFNKNNDIFNNKKSDVTFKNSNLRVDYGRNKIKINDILSVKSPLTIDKNENQPNLKINPVSVRPVSSNEIEIYSSVTDILGHKTAKKIANIYHNSAKTLPKVSLSTGKFSPFLMVEDNVNGKNVQIRLFQNSEFQTPDLKIKMYKQTINFKGNLVVNQVLGSDNTDKVLRDYFINNKFQKVQKGNYKLKNNYSIFGLTAGEGSRLLPISEIYDTLKPATPFPGRNKTFMEQSFLDVAVQTGVVNPLHIKDILVKGKNLKTNLKNGYIDKSKDFALSQLCEKSDELRGDLGPLLDIYKKGIIPENQSVMLLPADIFSNADYTKILSDFENSNSGFMLPSYVVSKEDMMGLPPIKVQEDGNVFSVQEFFDKVQSFDKSRDLEILEKSAVQTGKYKDKYLTSGSFFVIHSEIIKFLDTLISPEEKIPMFSRNLYKIFKFLNTNDNPHTYLSDDEYSRLQAKGYIDDSGNPVPPRNSKNEKLRMTCCVIKDKNDNLTVSRDIGTVASYLKTIYDIKNDRFSAGLSTEFVNSVKECVNENGVIFADIQSKKSFIDLSKKLNIEKLSGNIFVSEVKTDK